MRSNDAYPHEFWCAGVEKMYEAWKSNACTFHSKFLKEVCEQPAGDLVVATGEAVARPRNGIAAMAERRCILAVFLLLSFQVLRRKRRGTEGKQEIYGV